MSNQHNTHLDSSSFSVMIVVHIVGRLKGLKWAADAMSHSFCSQSVSLFLNTCFGTIKHTVGFVLVLTIM